MTCFRLGSKLALPASENKENSTDDKDEDSNCADNDPSNGAFG